MPRGSVWLWCVVAWIIGVTHWRSGCLQLVGAAPSASLPEGEQVAYTQLWLADEIFYDDINVYDKPQGDQGAEKLTDLCPPVPETLPEGSCHAQMCHSDRECGDSGRRKCCYNGCIYTCRPVLSPPAFLDWLREPRRRLSSGLSWLVAGPDEANQEEPCSTTPVDADADPLVCPEGYYCSLFDLGDPSRGLPNQGLCLKMADETVTAADTEMTSENKKDGGAQFPVRHAHACDLGGRMLLEGHVIVRDGQECICKRRQLSCQAHKDSDG